MTSYDAPWLRAEAGGWLGVEGRWWQTPHGWCRAVAHGSAKEMSAWLAGGAEEGAAVMEPELSEWCGAVGIFFSGSDAK
jgi:hypothetical protein